MSFSSTRNDRLASIPSVGDAELSRTSSLQPCISRASHGSRTSRPSVVQPGTPRKSLERIPSHVKCTYSPPSYDESNRHTFGSTDGYGNEWRCRLGVWYVVRPKGPRKSSTKPSDAPVVVNGKEWRKRFGVWCASRS